MGKLDRKVALITGSSLGSGKGIAQVHAKYGKAVFARHARGA